MGVMGRRRSKNEDKMMEPMSGRKTELRIMKSINYDETFEEKEEMGRGGI